MKLSPHMVEDAVPPLTPWNSKLFPRGILQQICPSCCSSQAHALIEINIVDVMMSSCKLWKCKSKQISCPSTSAGRSTGSRKGLGPEPGSRYLGRYQSCSGGRVRSLDLDPKAGNFCRYKTSQFQQEHLYNQWPWPIQVVVADWTMLIKCCLVCCSYSTLWWLCQMTFFSDIRPAACCAICKECPRSFNTSLGHWRSDVSRWRFLPPDL